MFALSSRFVKRGDWLRRRVQYNLFWNGSIRLFSEAYLELTLMSMLNVQKIFWFKGLTFVDSSNVLSLITLGLCTIVPFVLIAVVICNRNHLRSYSFRSKFSSVLEGSKSERGTFYTISLLVPLTYFFRRAFLSISILSYQKFFWG